MFIRGKPWVITLDDSLYFNSNGTLVFANTTSDEKVIWPAIIEKAWAKVVAGYGKSQTPAIVLDLDFVKEQVQETSTKQTPTGDKTGDCNGNQQQSYQRETSY